MVPEPPPPIAAEVSGRLYTLDPNDEDFSWFQLDFDSTEARLQLEDQYGPIDVVVGLDGTYRVSPARGQDYAFTGTWTTDHTFVVDWVLIGGAIRGSIEFSFEDDTVTFQFTTDPPASTLITGGQREG